MKNKALHILISSLLILCGAGLLYINLGSRPPEINLDAIPTTPEYTLTDLYSPIVNYDSTIFYPTVQTPPSNFKYPFVLIKEKIDLNQQNHDKLFFAAKRVAELREWRNEIRVLNIVNLDEKLSPLSQLKQWWASDPENHKFFSSNYPTWEAGLIRYYESFNEYSNNAEKFEGLNRYTKTNELNKRLIADQATLQKAIIFLPFL